MSLNQEEARGTSGHGEHEAAMPSRWWRAAAISVVLWVFLSLPLLGLSGRALTWLLYHPDGLAKNISSMDFVMMAVMLIVSPLPIVSGIAAIAFLSLRSARSRRIAAICLSLSLVGMATLVVAGIASVIEGEQMGGDTGPLQVMASILIGVVLPTLIIMPSIIGLISLRRLKYILSEKKTGIIVSG
jgi:hypothetical protein